MANETPITISSLVADPPAYTSMPTTETLDKWIPTYVYRGHGNEVSVENKGNISKNVPDNCIFLTFTETNINLKNIIYNKLQESFSKRGI